MKTCTLNDVVIGTVFKDASPEAEEAWYRKGANFQGEQVKCEPLLGGKWQPSLMVWITLDKMITVYPTRPGEDLE